MKIDTNKIIRKKFVFHTKEIDEDKYVIRGIFSTGKEDRQNEVIDQNGWKLEEYMENPVVLFAHDPWQPAVAKVIELGIDVQGNLSGAIQFAVEEYEFAKTLFNLYAGRYMRAFSVGFMNNKYEIDQENDVVYLKENTLYEISCVNVPANAMALAYSKGIDVEPLKKVIGERKNRMEKGGEKKDEIEKSPACRLDSESKNDCLGRKIPELEAEGMEHDQAIAAAESICSIACSEKSAKSAVEIISKSNKETILSAIEVLKGILEADREADIKVGPKGRTPLVNKGGTKKIPIKLLNRAVKELLKIKRVNKLVK